MKVTRKVVKPEEEEIRRYFFGSIKRTSCLVLPSEDQILENYREVIGLLFQVLGILQRVRVELDLK